MSLLIYGSNAKVSLLPSIGQPSFSDFDSDPAALMPGETGSGGLVGSDITTVDQVGSPFPNNGLAVDFFAQKSKNPKTAAWIAVPNVCYYPVMFSGDNTWFLDHNVLGGYSKQGAIFADASNKPDFDSGAVLTYGRRAQDGSMYAWLQRFESESFFRANPPIELFDGEYLRYYIPFTVLLAADNAGSPDLTAKSPDDYKAHMAKLMEQSIVKLEPYKTPDLTAPTLFLAAFDDESLGARLIVGAYQAKKIRYILED